MKTFTAKLENIRRNWYIMDASNKILGRFASNIALRLRGKHKVIYTPHIDTGDYIIVLNAKKITVTGNKLSDKKYYHYTGFVGGIKEQNLKDLMTKRPEYVIERAVKGMLPKGALGKAMLKKLKVYAGTEHQHAAQQPQVLEI
ncbi:50S ribosomal protein L13 [Candidatus Palibaumannia cicadellinicola]|uniref:Large ribosomal subunit protein uL13 n=1 Tax=Baumannia cicadellinicola subsp. Homalodisca coagulata TaxID=374463 RepID=RL13_BAUCH|nr:50S ribosomal protein L13 [Candidatus Baumannia cicadellinicola]Q1LU54.1 RecName: Full=Large ribosomal subunit protein uL13; AltName: Full=50S ribosomal protein L13 [Baumannia cicadellinicola str. Hc (Homalodisca coagulata)]ABF14298.1 ribosomal protein L13 [Baumannia cicadellinicola str. Hc (Homalodisca coagulata)]MBS0032577.1 50S ribosomal protein L13 [Candidatus Baumannia cicadellinicola]MCJ7462019.1 50S ribosomal protein L13 [Candidatus Baumannia cicadellinicola]MCJ7462568.1 50S ribosoma